MKDILKPTMAELQPLIDQVGDLAAWEPQFVKGMVEFFDRAPLRYRGYGPYWWLLKQALIDHGVTRFDDHVDAEAVETLDYGSRALNMLAAFAFSEYTFNMGLMTASQHSLEKTDGDYFEYVIADDDMELLHASI